MAAALGLPWAKAEVLDTVQGRPWVMEHHHHCLPGCAVTGTHRGHLTSEAQGPAPVPRGVGKDVCASERQSYFLF